MSSTSFSRRSLIGRIYAVCVPAAPRWWDRGGREVPCGIAGWAGARHGAGMALGSLEGPLLVMGETRMCELYV